MPSKAHLAQVNIARMNTPLEDPAMAGFVARLDEINALADRSPGFVWRLQTSLAEKGATPYTFTFKQVFPPDEAVIRATDWSGFEPCPAT